MLRANSLSVRSRLHRSDGRALAWLDSNWLPLTGLIATSIAILNIRSVHLFHTIEKHLVFKARILHGFTAADVVPSYPTPPTFPMWGYGWVLLLTTNTAALVGIQMAAAVAATWYLFHAIDQADGLSRRARPLLQLLIVVCTPWFAYHSIVWSQSLATSFLMLSLALLIGAAAGHGRPWLIIALSAVCFGLNLNLASDLYLLPLGIATATMAVSRWSHVSAVHALAWLAGVGAMMAPWMIYTWHATGTPLVKSTNQGHVLLIGLGQDPQNRFGVTYSDGDPTMYGILRTELGDTVARRFYASCSFEADPVLKRAFVRMVSSQPAAYLDLLWIKMRRILSGDVGIYPGEFDEGENVGLFGIGQPVRRFVRRYTIRAGRLLQLGTTILAPLVTIVALRRRQIAWTFVLLPIVYLYLSCSVAVVQPQYVASVILLQLLVCAQGIGLLIEGIETVGRT
jgi:hypothetical protein